MMNNKNRAVLAVFQASPLAYEDWKGKNHVVPIPLLDLDSEVAMLKDAVKNACIDIMFEQATSNSLGAFLSAGGKFLHFSCHGHPKYIMIENHYGGGQKLLVDQNLRAWISAGDNNLSFVFVSSCHSRSAGETFVAAGVSHVVCCEQDDQELSNTVAMVFARDFYRAVGDGNTIKKAFKLAKGAVLQAPEVVHLGLKAEEEVKKFKLLPEGVNHDVALFSRASPRPQVKTLQEERSHRRESKLTVPTPPENFVGRELDMYNVLKTLILENVRLVRITGPPGIGKSSVAKCLAQYMEKRRIWGDIFWIPSYLPEKDEGSITFYLSKLGETLQASSGRSGASLKKNNVYQKALRKILDELYGKKALLIFDARHLSPERLCVFLEDLFNMTRLVKVIVIHRLETPVCPEKATGFSCSEASFCLKPLGFNSTVHIFVTICPHVSSRDHRQLSRALLKLKSSDDLIFKFIGEGIPENIIANAKSISRDEVQSLVRAEDFTALSNDSSFKEYEKKTGRNYEKLQEMDKIQLDFPRDLEEREECQPNDLRAASDQDDDPIRSQDEVSHRFVTLIRKEGRVYRKKVTTFLRRALMGELIVTTIDGIHETHQTVKDDNSWVACGRAAGEYYVMSDKQFKESYDEKSERLIKKTATHNAARLRDLGFYEYHSKRKVWARKVDEQDMRFFRYGRPHTGPGLGEAYFVAPWGESMRVEQGDYLVLQYPYVNDEIYRIECRVFEDSYGSNVGDDDEDGTKLRMFWFATGIGLVGIAAGFFISRSRSSRK